VTAEHLQVLVGQEWGEALCDEIHSTGLDARAWGQEHINVLKSTPTSLVGLLELKGQPCYFKFYQSKSWWQKIVFRLGLGRGSRSYRVAGELSAKDIAVPQPLACLLTRHGMILLTEAISGASDMQSLWEEGLATPENPCWRNAGVVLGHLHNAGFSHGDYKWSNLLGADEVLYLVDLEAVSKVGSSSNKPYRDIARFTLNAEDMGAPRSSYENFLNAYLKETDSEEEDVVRRTLPILNGLRTHHISKYGPRGHALMGVDAPA